MLQMSVWKEEMNCKNPLLGSSLIKFLAILWKFQQTSFYNF